MHTLITALAEIAQSGPSFKITGLFYEPATITTVDMATAKRYWFDTRGGGQSAIWKVEAV